MPKLSYGPAAKARTQQLLMALLDYANDELWPSEDASPEEEEQFERSLDALRPHLSSHWKSNGQSPALGERDLIIRTKIRYLEKLTQLSPLTSAISDSDQPKPLSANQIKEALSHLGKFLGILEDNRTSRRGSDTWHFTLHLGAGRRDRPALQTWFSQTWESRHPKQAKVSTTDSEVSAVPPQEQPSRSPAPSSKTSKFWQDLCRQDLANRRHNDLTTNPLTAQVGLQFATEELYIPTELVKQIAIADASEETADSALPKAIATSQFLEQLKDTDQSRAAIVGEPGAGKTTLLQQAAAWILEQTTDIPIWISLADLDKPAELETHIFEQWLKTALRQRTVPTETQHELEQQFSQGQVWLLLDAVDEMAIAPSLALTQLAQQLNGWLGNARVIITSRVNIWEGGKNALGDVETYQLQSYACEPIGRSGGAMDRAIATIPNSHLATPIQTFIQRWFKPTPETAQQLLNELTRPERKRIRETVRNPLRLALLCRLWSASRGHLPETKALLYAQFVEAIYEWKQDYFPTSLSQRQQLNQALGAIALHAMQQPTPLRRIPESRLCQALTDASLDLSLLDLALQLGWLIRVPSSGETAYRFYHTTFQEYFAARRIERWQDLVEMQTQCLATGGETINPIFSNAWREVILLWFGRQDVSAVDKAQLMSHLGSIEADCGGFLAAQGLLLAGRALAEFAEYEGGDAIADQLVQWRFDRYGKTPRAIAQATQSVLSQSDQATVIAALERFVQDPELFTFKRWMAAYSLGRSYDPGNKLAIATLTELLHDAPFSDNDRINLARNLGTIDPGNRAAIAWFEGMLDSLSQTQDKPQLERKAALRLGLIDSGNEKAIATLVRHLESNPEPFFRQQLLEDLAKIAPQHPLITAIASTQEVSPTPVVERNRRRKSKQIDKAKGLASVLQRLEEAESWSAKLRLVKSLCQYEPGHPVAIAILLQGLKETEQKHQLKSISQLLQETVADAQISEVLVEVRAVYLATLAELEIGNRSQKEDIRRLRVERERSHVCHAVLWHWSNVIPMQRFQAIWQSMD